MKITIVRTGGIAGVEAQLGPVDTLELPIGGVIVRKVQEIEFFELPEELPQTGAPVPDGFSYAMTVEEDERRHTVGYGSASEADARRRLFEVQKLLVQAGCDFKWGSGRGVVAGDDGFTWEAWYNRMPGSHDPNLYVVGTGTVRSSSIQLVLEPGNVGVVPDPTLFVLDLKIVTPEEFGDDRMTEKQAIWRGDVGPGIQQVEVRGDAEATVPVTEIQ
ncbi:MAG TPA: hypothetical protein VFY48_04795 [Solirubrobacterales bacterium]|nr:hypothetical protein [Solirubrobacterales bacterium]